MSSATSTMSSTRREVRDPPAGEPAPRPRAFVGMAVAAWTALLGLAAMVCVALAAWVTANHHDDAIRPALSTAVQAWLLAHHGGLLLSGKPGGSLTIVPLGVTIALAAVLVRAGRTAARLSGAHDLLDCLTTALSVAVPYGVIAALMTSAGRTNAVRPSPLQALAGAFVLAACCVAVGALRETDQLRPLLMRLPSDARATIKAALAASAVLVGGGAAIVVLGLAGTATRAGDLVSSLGGGLSGAVLMAVVSMAYAPNAVMWAVAYSVGPGFAVGSGTAVGLAGVRLGAVPALPLLAPLPHSGAAPLVSWAAIALPLGSGVAAGWLLWRARGDGVGAVAPGSPWWVRFHVTDATWAAAAGAASGVLIALLAWASRGSLGPGRMSHVGPSPWWVGLAAALEIALAGAATVCTAGWLAARRSRSDRS